VTSPSSLLDRDCSPPTKLNRSYVPAVLICQNSSSSLMQSSATAMPSPATLLPFAWLDVNRPSKLKQQAAQIETKIASVPGIERWESGFSRVKRRMEVEGELAMTLT